MYSGVLDLNFEFHTSATPSGSSEESSYDASKSSGYFNKVLINFIFLIFENNILRNILVFFSLNYSRSQVKLT